MPTPSVLPPNEPGAWSFPRRCGASVGLLASLAAAALLAACGKSSTSGALPGGSLTVSAVPLSAVADGTSTIAVHVEGSTKGPVTVSTTRGTLPDGTNRMSFAATPIDTVVTSCDAGVDSTCAGSTRISALDANLAAGLVNVTFTAPSSQGCTGCPSAACTGQVCDALGHTCSSSLTCTVCPGGSTEICNDGVDNNCDGLVDCADPTCLGQTCAPNSVCQNTAPAGQPPNVQCVNAATVFAVTVTSSASRIPANGVATATITAAVTNNGSPAPAGRTVNFAQTGTAATLSAASATTNSSGQATVTLTSDAAGGTATVTATDAGSGQSGSVAVVMPQLGQVNLLSPLSGILGVRYSGFQETMLLTFQLIDTANASYPAGLAVSFTHQSLGTSYIGPTANCSAGIPSICTASGVTNSQGQVSVLLTSGKAAGVVTVLASATAGGLSAQGTASNFAVVGARASGAHITIDCAPKNVPAFTNSDCNFSHYGGPGSTITCTASFADRFNNVLGVSTLATFGSEGGSAGPPASTPMYDPKQPPTSQTGLGVATDFVAVNGGKLPLDVPAFAGEYSLVYPDACGTLEHNPRDGLNTIVVMANGEEGFVDLNGNGVYDVGEPFIDMGEPYIDENDNGKWDPGEPFWDLNGNLTYDGPNGVWDANTVIWAETRVLYTGFPKVISVATPTPAEEASRFYDSGAPPDPTPTANWGTLYGSPGPSTSAALGVVFMDGNFNTIIPAATYAIAPIGTGVVTAKFTRLPTTVDNLGMTFTQQYCGSSPPPSAANGWTVTPTNCANVCTSSPCYVVANVGNCSGTTCSGFSYGSWATAQITGACSAPGSDIVEATCTVNSVATPIDVAGDCYPCQLPQRYCGTSCTNVQTDAKNCGTCGNACLPTQTCVTGICQ